MKTAIVLTLVAFSAATRPGPQVPAPSTWQISAGESSVQIEVDRAGLFSFAGHRHRIIAPVSRGQVVFAGDDPTQMRLDLVFDAATLTVDPEGEPEDDVEPVQARMRGPDVLDVEQYPTIRYRSTGVEVIGSDGGAVTLRVAGELTLRGVTRTVSADATMSASANELRGQATIELKQTDFGISPVAAGLGTVRVKDEVEIVLSLVARR